MPPREIHITPWGWVTRPAAFLLFLSGMAFMWCIDHRVHDWRVALSLGVGVLCFLFCTY